MSPTVDDDGDIDAEDVIGEMRVIGVVPVDRTTPATVG
jgi:hypothetical protein